MGKKWDNSGIAYDLDLWTECLRVLKPGGHLLAFGGTRTYHRMASAIEDAGFEIRDSIHWLYGSGFPKSHDVSKAIDKRGGASVDFASFRDEVKVAMRRNEVSRSQLQNALGNFMLSHYLTAGSQPAIPNARDYRIIRDTVGLGDKFDHLFSDEAEREVIGTKSSGIANKDEGPRHTIGASQAVVVDITAPATDAAKQWQGWGTALKPAHEPIVVARKPLVGTVAANVQQHGTGALNIDGCRVGFASDDDRATAQSLAELRARGRRLGLLGEPGQGNSLNAAVVGDTRDGTEVVGTHAAGRWPANVITDGSIDAEWVRYFYVAKASKAERNAGLDALPLQEWTGNYGAGIQDNRPHMREGYVYESTTKNTHPTVKPLALMRYLVRLVTPPGGTVLEPFAGSGTTLAAAILEGFDVIGCELTDDYLPIIEGRIAWAEEQMKPDPESLCNQ
jgi:DNA modification methylase